MKRTTWLWLAALGFAVGCATQEAPAPAPAPAPTPAPAPAASTPKPAPQAAAPKPVAEKVTFATDVLFDFDNASIKPEGKSKLDDLAGKVKGINLEVVIFLPGAGALEVEITTLVTPSGARPFIVQDRAEPVSPA